MASMKVTTKNGHTKPHYRPTWAEISLSAIEYNYKQVKRFVGKDTNIMVVVKANAPYEAMYLSHVLTPP